MAYIELNNISYKYPLTKEDTIKDLTLNIEKGKFYAIIGENGCGKTTLCNIIRGFIPSFFKGEMKGEVIIDGVNIEEYDRGFLAKKIGYVFQNPFNQITGARETVFEEIAYGLENFGVQKEKIVEKVEEVMKITNIVELSDKNPFELSGGQQQRVAFASILVLEPDIFVIDEPTSQLDPKESQRIYEIILKMKDMGKTIILVEHDIELLVDYVDEVIVLNNGKLVACGEKHDILKDISLEDYGIDLPKAILIKNGLRKNNIHLENNVLTKEELLESIESYLKRRL